MVRKDMNNVDKAKSQSKPVVEIIVPAGKCGCSYSTWIERIWDKLDEYRDQIIIETFDTNSARAKGLHITGQALLVNEERVPLIYLKEKLKQLLKIPFIA